MKITLTKREAMYLFNQKSISGGRSQTMPDARTTDEHIYLEAGNGYVRTVLQDHGIMTALETKIAKNGTDEGSCYVPQIASDIIKKAPDTDITIEVDKDQGKITFAGGQYLFPVFDANDTPSSLLDFKKDGQQHVCTMKGGILQKCLTKALNILADGREEIDILNHILVKSTPEKIDIVSTDRHKLIDCVIEGAEEGWQPNDTRTVFIHRIAANIVKTNIGEGEISLEADEKKCMIVDRSEKDVEMSIMFPNNKVRYPDWERIFPKLFVTKMKVGDASLLLKAIKRVSAVSSRTEYQVLGGNAIKIELGTDSIDLSTYIPGYTKSRETWPCQIESAETADRQVTMTGDNLMTTLANIGEDECTICMNTSRQALLFEGTPQEKDGQHVTTRQIVMPCIPPAAQK